MNLAGICAKRLLPSYRYDRFAATRPQNTTGHRPRGPNRYDPSSGKTTMRIKSVIAP